MGVRMAADGSSIPIPDGVSVRLVALGQSDELLEMFKVADLPKLYEAWAESRVESVARGLVTAASGVDDAFDSIGDATRQDALNTAAELLDLGDRS
jgi:hypothetical protein